MSVQISEQPQPATVEVTDLGQTLPLPDEGRLARRRMRGTDIVSTVSAPASPHPTEVQVHR